MTFRYAPIPLRRHRVERADGGLSTRLPRAAACIWWLVTAPRNRLRLALVEDVRIEKRLRGTYFS